MNPDNFLLDTDYPVDQIIYMNSGSFTATTSMMGDKTVIAHGLSFRPLLVGQWSYDSDFSTCKECFAPVYTDVDGVYVECYSNDTNITFWSFNLSGSNKTIYWRVIGFMPSDSTEDADFTASTADNYIINTDYNYTKLWYNNIVPASAPVTITHNFGYRPQVMAWVKDYSVVDGTTYLIRDDTNTIKVTDTTVVVTSSTKDVHLRIYADRQI